MNKNLIVKQLREIAAYVECNDVPELLSVHVSGAAGNQLHGWVADNATAMFVQWCDDLDCPVEITATFTSALTFQVHGRGLLADDETPVTLLVCLGPKESQLLAAAIGVKQDVAVPVSRDLLAKIADPELLDDRAEVSF